MKEVLITLGVLLLVMFGFYWVNNRYVTEKKEVVVVLDKEIFFKAPENMKSGTETEIVLKAKSENLKVASFSIDFSYDPGLVKIVNVEVNNKIFDKVASVKIEENLGKVIMEARSGKTESSLSSGEVDLATIKVVGARKGGTMIYSSKRPEVGVFESGKIVEGNFQMPNFKVNFL